MDDKKLLYDWFDDKFKLLNNVIKLPHRYHKTDIPNNYTNIITDLHKVKNKNKFSIDIENIADTDNNTDVCISHKYEISFSKQQKKILDIYFNECDKLYNLCVSIWKNYNDVTDCWQILKDIIFKHLYRSREPINNIDNVIKNIINELKQKKDEYDTENLKYKEKIEEEKKRVNEEYKKALELWKNKVSKAKKKGIVLKIDKPKKQKIKIEKLKAPKKPRGPIIKKPAPDETLKGVIRVFCKDLKTNREKQFNNRNFNFEMKNKNIEKKHTIIISNRNICKNGIYVNSLGKLEDKRWNKIFTKYDISQECLLTHNKVFGKYYITITCTKKKKEINNKKKVVAIDEGEKIFLTFYSQEEYGKIGDNMRIKITKLLRKKSKIQSLMDKRINRYGNLIRNKKSLKKRIAKIYKKIEGYVNEIHKKGAKYLCENYDIIILPEFETKPLLSTKKKESEYKRIMDINEEKDRRTEMRVLKKAIKISKEVKDVLRMQSHYKFKKYLKAKAKEYGTIVYDVTEEYTSQACTKCGRLSKKYTKDRTKECECGYKIDRDINGSRNILIKSIKDISKIVG